MPDIFISPASHKKATSFPVKKSRDSLFSTFLYMPEDVRFETQQVGETIILLLRKHWVTNLSWLLITFFLIIIPVYFFPVLSSDSLIPSQVSSGGLLFIVFIWYLLTFSYLLVNFLLWYFTVSIVTNERIIDIDFVNILHKKFSATRISKVEDVTLKTGGFIRTIFDYGDVIIQTAGTNVFFGFYAVPHPEKVVRTINDLMEEKEGGH